MALQICVSPTKYVAKVAVDFGHGLLDPCHGAPLFHRVPITFGNSRKKATSLTAPKTWGRTPFLTGHVARRPQNRPGPPWPWCIAGWFRGKANRRGTIQSVSPKIQPQNGSSRDSGYS